MIVTCKSDSEDIRIYLDGVLHIRIPRDKNIKIQSWIESYTKLYFIEIWCVKHSDFFQYESEELWKEILKKLDENI